MKVRITITLFNKVLTNDFDSDKITIEDRDLDTFVLDKDNGNVLLIAPKDKITTETITEE